MKTLLITLFSGLPSCLLFAQQNDSTAKISISGYVEAYYSYDFNQPTHNERPSFIYSHNRHNEFSINLGFVKAAYTSQQLRANLALMAGTYSNANLAAEPATLRNIYEANVGVKLSKTRQLWLDAGVFSSHIGFESAVSKDCWALTRSLMADNTPYYETGAKIGYTSPNEKWYLAGLVLNGWQQMRRPDGNTRLAVGTQVTYKPTSKLTFNSSTFVGSRPDDTNRNRFFHNFYGIFQVTNRWGMIADVDYGIEQRQTGASVYDSWASWAVILRYQLTPHFALAGRAEKYTDKQGIVIATAPPHGFSTQGFSCNLDYTPLPNVAWRMEARKLSSKDAIFEKQGRAVSQTFALTTSLAISF
ncbi:MAG: porin [Bacteroidetes bacterium]|nr:porin [Bacteroidota bacterium]